MLGYLMLYICFSSLDSVQTCEVTSGPPTDVPEFGVVPVGMVGVVILGLVCGDIDEAKAEVGRSKSGFSGSALLVTCCEGTEELRGPLSCMVLPWSRR